MSGVLWSSESSNSFTGGTVAEKKALSRIFNPEIIDIMRFVLQVKHFVIHFSNHADLKGIL